MRKATYRPSGKDFTPKLAEGKSILEGRDGAKGRTKRERDKQSKRFQRIRTRSHEDRESQGKSKK